MFGVRVGAVFQYEDAQNGMDSTITACRILRWIQYFQYLFLREFPIAFQWTLQHLCPECAGFFVGWNRCFCGGGSLKRLVLSAIFMRIILIVN